MGNSSYKTIFIHFILSISYSLNLYFNLSFLIISVGYFQIGIKIGSLKLIKFFPWGLLSGYLFAILIFLIIIVKGDLLVRSLVWSKYGMLIKSNQKSENELLVNEKIIFYVTIFTLSITLLLFTTYMVVLSLSWIQMLEDEIELD